MPRLGQAALGVFPAPAIQQGGAIRLSCASSLAAFAEAPTAVDGFNADFRSVFGGAAKSDGSCGAVKKRPAGLSQG